MTENILKLKKKAFIFDLDGVIVDTAKFHYLAWRNLAKEMNFDFTEEQNELFKGVSRVRSLEILLDLASYDATQEQKDRWLIQKNEEYLKYIKGMDDSEILPDVVRVLDFLEEKNQEFEFWEHINRNHAYLDSGKKSRYCTRERK